MKTVTLIAVVTTLLGAVHLASAGERKVQEISVEKVDTSEDAWTKLGDPDGVVQPPEEGGKQAPVDDQRHRARVALTEQADRLRMFAAEHPDSPHVMEARQKEALILLQAALFGDDANAERRQALVAELTADVTLSEIQRYEVAAGAANLEIFAKTYDSLEAFTLEQERVARVLIGEFPKLEIPYESLLGLATSSSEKRGRAVAREILKMDSPESIKEKARAFLARVKTSTGNEEN